MPLQPCTVRLSHKSRMDLRHRQQMFLTGDQLNTLVTMVSTSLAVNQPRKFFAPMKAAGHSLRHVKVFNTEAGNSFAPFFRCYILHLEYLSQDPTWSSYPGDAQLATAKLVPNNDLPSLSTVFERRKNTGIWRWHWLRYSVSI
ncbi:unnamed protein product [Gongylonema pulchrum]|uniref:Uncharacterized protein n=1 Tax=Gongylonema pulchrum TaxID=637853 RepID=A0A3P7PYI2_9BILA|nr:unnamed protein product [Gongylonema pulchrum]